MARGDNGRVWDDDPELAAAVEDAKAEHAAHAPLALTDFYAYLPQHRYIYIPTGDLWPDKSVTGALPPVRVGTTKEGEPRFQSAAKWLDENRSVQAMTWAPGEPQLIEGRLIRESGWVEKEGAACFNLYMPPQAAAGDPTKAGPWLDHGRQLYPDNFDHIRNCFSHRVQRPWEKLNHSIVLGGAPRIGKDGFIAPLRYAVGDWNFHDAMPADFMGQFNKNLAQCIVLRVNEARDLGDFDRITLYERTKIYMAEPPEVLRCNDKNIKVYYIPNRVFVIITTNHRVESLYLPPDDARHYCAWSERTEAEFDAAYWKDYWGWLEAGGYAHVAAYLAQVDLSGFNPKTPPPRTEMFRAIVNNFRPPENAQLLDVLDELEWPYATTINTIITQATSMGALTDFVDWCKEKRNQRALSMRLSRCGYDPVPNPDTEQGYWRIDSVRQNIYVHRTFTREQKVQYASDLQHGTVRTMGERPNV